MGIRMHPTQKPWDRRFIPHVERLEDRLVLFKSWLTLEPNHEYITASALWFLREDVVDEINFEHVVQETLEAFTSSAHMDNCEMKQSASRINLYYRQAIQAADPYQFDSEETAELFGKLLHAVQDFYAHSNWVDSGMQTLIDQNLGFWNALEPYSYHDGALLVQGTNQQPFGPGSLSRQGFRVTVKRNGINYPGIVTGTFGFGSHQCPRVVAIAHGSPITPQGLNKDGPNEYNGARYEEAAWLAMVQTEHEFYRLYSLIEAIYGTAQHLLDAWLQPGTGPAGAVADSLAARRREPRYLPAVRHDFPDVLPARFSMLEMDRRYLPALAAEARARGVPDHPHLAILTSGDYAARLALGEELHSHEDHAEEELEGDDAKSQEPPGFAWALLVGSVTPSAESRWPVHPAERGWASTFVSPLAELPSWPAEAGESNEEAACESKDQARFRSAAAWDNEPVSYKIDLQYT